MRARALPFRQLVSNHILSPMRMLFGTGSALDEARNGALPGRLTAAERAAINSANGERPECVTCLAGDVGIGVIRH